MVLLKYCDRCRKETEWNTDEIFDIMCCTNCGNCEILAEQIASHKKYWLK